MKAKTTILFFISLIVLILGGGIVASVLCPKQQTGSNSHRI
jgi:hypothetical protein